MLRRIRPYELEKGAADAAFDRALDEVIEGMERSGLRGQATGFKRALAIMDAVPYDRSNPHPTVLIVGEYLLNFHLGANHEIERYLEDNGLEVIEARMTDVIRKTYFYKHAQSRETHVDLSLPKRPGTPRRTTCSSSRTTVATAWARRARSTSRRRACPSSCARAIRSCTIRSMRARAC